MGDRQIIHPVREIQVSLTVKPLVRTIHRDRRVCPGYRPRSRYRRRPLLQRTGQGGATANRAAKWIRLPILIHLLIMMLVMISDRPTMNHRNPTHQGRLIQRQDLSIKLPLQIISQILGDAIQELQTGDSRILD